MRTLFTGGTIRTVDRGIPEADWLLVEDETIAGLGPRDDAPAADRAVELGGGALVPAFCDAHVHLPATGLYATGLDFRGERSAPAIVDAFRRRASAGSDLLFGGNFEDPLDAPLTRADLDRAVGERPALLVRADMHSAIVSTALLDRLDVSGLEGVDVDAGGVPTGYLREKAAAEAWRWFESGLPRRTLDGAIRGAVQLAYSKGIGSVHEMYVVEWRGWTAFEVLQEIADDVALAITSYVATPDVGRVMELGLDRIGGDFFLDGSFGSHTAWLSRPYEPTPPAATPPAGISYRSDGELTAFFTAAQRAGLQTGVHAIGDAAIEQALRCWERVADVAGRDAVRSLRHRIEHFECASDDHIARAAALNIAASVQPAFDLYWGGADGLYARRIGAERALRMNRFRTMIDAGLAVGAGSDSTVTPLDPFLQMQALRTHHVASERLDGLTALAAHTLWAQALAGHDEGLGSLTPGKRADLALLDRDPVPTDAGAVAETGVVGTWIAGRRVWPEPD